jgi:hypothetical protein
MHKEIMKMINKDIPKAEAAIATMISNFNSELANHNATTFLVNLLKDPNVLLNLTATKAPLLDASTNLLTMNFDGLFYDVLK